MHMGYDDDTLAILNSGTGPDELFRWRREDLADLHREIDKINPETKRRVEITQLGELRSRATHIYQVILQLEAHS